MGLFFHRLWIVAVFPLAYPVIWLLILFAFVTICVEEGYAEGKNDAKYLIRYLHNGIKLGWSGK